MSAKIIKGAFWKCIPLNAYNKVNLYAIIHLIKNKKYKTLNANGIYRRITVKKWTQYAVIVNKINKQKFQFELAAEMQHCIMSVHL